VILGVPLAGYPLALVASGGAPSFPSAVFQCAPPAVEGQKVDVVFGRFDTLRESIALRDRALSVGFQGTEAVPDDCGRVVVRIHGIKSIKVGKEIQAEAATVDLKPDLELSR
jgi:hypothetical protein